MGSVYSNIAYANPDATKEEVVQAAVLARDVYKRQGKHHVYGRKAERYCTKAE